MISDGMVASIAPGDYLISFTVHIADLFLRVIIASLKGKETSETNQNDSKGNQVPSEEDVSFLKSFENSLAGNQFL
jgi:hypothetical protein